ncbi:hypothetical protein EAF00_005857 [Botryotinia globosa]|nr:hypothetical protein EAF00_005857 [Botryotinia globosa]
MQENTDQFTTNTFADIGSEGSIVKEALISQNHKEKRHGADQDLEKKRGCKGWGFDVTRGRFPHLKDRDTSPLPTSHLSSLDVTQSTADVEAIIFSNSSCVLQAEGEVGPSYVSGEYIRSDLRESEEDVPVVVDAEFLDISTCTGISDLYWDIWNANSTGVYSGVPGGDGNGNSADTTNIDKTFLRGLQPTDDEGVVQFTTLLLGNYTGRTNHIHVVAQVGGSILPNGTYNGGNVTHIGQLFFDQSLITQVEAVSPYSINMQELTLNADDIVLLGEIYDHYFYDKSASVD